jgi:hypothetical protein
VAGNNPATFSFGSFMATQTFNPMGWHIIMPYQYRDFTPDVASLRVAKLIGAWDNNDVAYYHELKALNPNLHVIGRETHVFDLEHHPNGLHQRMARGESPTQAAADFSSYLIDLTQAHNLHEVAWEGGPNEPDVDSSAWCVAYSLEFGARMNAAGLRYAVGGYSYGSPHTPPFDSVDTWASWLPVFKMINQHNRQVGRDVAYLYVHEYMESKHKTGMTFHSQRYRHAYENHIQPGGLDRVPLLITELGFAPSLQLCALNTQEVVREMTGYMQAAMSDIYVAGATVFTLNHTVWDDHNFAPHFRDLMSAFRQVALPAPPAPSPLPPPAPAGSLVGKRVRVAETGLRIRITPSTDRPPLGTLNKSSELLVVAQSGKWLQVTHRDFNLGTWWVHRDYVAVIQ